MNTKRTSQNAQNQKNTTDWLTEKQTRRLAFLYQSMFIGVLADIRAEEFIEIVKQQPEYRANHKNVRKYVAMLQRAIKNYEYQQFQGYAAEMRQKYLEIAQPILADETIMHCTITNNLHHAFTERANLVAAFMQCWLLSKLSCLIIQDNGIGRFANLAGIDGTNTGITAINKHITTISLCFDNVIEKDFDMSQVVQAFHILDAKFETDETLLLRVIAANGLKIKWLDKEGAEAA